MAFGKWGASRIVQGDRALELTTEKLGRGGEGTVGVKGFITTAFFSGDVRSEGAGFAIGEKLADWSVQLIVFPSFLGEKSTSLVPLAGDALFFASVIERLRFFQAGGKVFQAGAVELAILPVSGVAREAVGPPASGGAI